MRLQMDAGAYRIPDSSEAVCSSCVKLLEQEIDPKIQATDSDEELVYIKSQLIEQYGRLNGPSCQAYLERYIASQEPVIKKIRKKREEENEKKSLEERNSQITEEDINNYMSTSGFNFEGYVIKKYCRIVNGYVVLETGFLSEFAASFNDMFEEESNAFANKMQIAQEAAMKKMIRQSILSGGNAVIGVNFSYVKFSSNMIGVAANGTSVMIEQV